MGDLRFSRRYAEVRDAPSRIAFIRQLSDDEVIAALAGASQDSDPLLANVLATEALNRVQRGRRVIASVAEGVIVLDRDGSITQLNESAERMFGWLSHEIVGRNVRELLVGASRSDDVATSALAPLRSGEVNQSAPVELAAREGAPFHALLESSPIVVNGEVTGVVVVVRSASQHGGPTPTAAEGHETGRGAPRTAAASHSTPAPELPRADPRPKIMIVEDESVVRMALEDTLTRMGYEVVAAVASGERAVEVAQGRHLDLILMDIMLEGEMDGIAAAEAIRATVDVPVVYLTAFSDEETVKRAKIAEPASYLVKPYQEPELRAVVEVALHNSALQHDRKRAMEALLSREKLLQEIVDQTPNAVFLKDDDGQYLLVNREFERICGVARAHAKGKTDAEALSSELATVFSANDEIVLREGRAVEFIGLVPSDDGPHTYLFHKFPLRASDNTIAGVCAVGTDVTDHRSVEATILNLQNQLEERVREREALLRDKQALERSKGDLEAFTYSVSHDLRAPVRGIAVLTDALYDDYVSKLDPEGVELIERVRNESRNLLTLIRDLLEFNRAGASNIRLEVVDLTKIAQEVMAALRDRPHKRAGEVSVIIQPGLNARGDPALLRVALENLLENAWKYTANTSTARIEFGVTKGTPDAEPVYFVRDNGIGFDMKLANRLFVPFQRLHQSEEYPGTGLGLTSVRRIIESHGGKIWVDARVGGGATFYFTLPSPESQTRVISTERGTSP